MTDKFKPLQLAYLGASEMSDFAETYLRQQEKVNAYFQSESSYWKDVYTLKGVQAEIIRDRHAAVLEWIDGMTLAPGSHVLEVGCGTGLMAVALPPRAWGGHGPCFRWAPGLVAAAPGEECAGIHSL